MDHPINLISEELLENKEILPQMRYLLDDKLILELVIQLLFEGVRIANPNAVEKEKIRSVLGMMLEEFMKILNLKELKKKSILLNFLNEEH